MKKKELIIRLLLFTLFSCLLPFVFIGWRYQIFKKASESSFTGWGVIGLIIVFIFVIYLTKVASRIKKYSMFKQCLLGGLKVLIPLLATYIFLTSIQENITNFLQVLIVVIICETIAIPINPLPQWEYENDVNFFENIIIKNKEGDK